MLHKNVIRQVDMQRVGWSHAREKEKVVKRFVLTAAMIALATTATAADVSIATGKAGGGYDAAAQKLAIRLSQRGHDVTITNMQGSDEITLALCSGAANVGIAQIDAVDAREAEGCVLRPVGNYGNEVAVILFPPKSKMNELDDFKGSERVLVDTVGSGTELFWRTIVRIETGEHGNGSNWAKATPINDPASLASTLAEFGDIDAVILVRKPDSEDIKGLLKRGWTLGELYDKDINDYQFNGTSLYEPSKVKIEVSGRRKNNYGYVVRSFFSVNNDLASDRNTMAQVAGAAN